MNPLILKIAQIVLTVFLVLLVEIQSKGKGLASGLGGSFTFYRSKRGIEKAVFFLTILSAALLVANSLLLVING